MLHGLAVEGSVMNQLGCKYNTKDEQQKTNNQVGYMWRAKDEVVWTKTNERARSQKEDKEAMNEEISWAMEYSLSGPSYVRDGI